MTKLEEWLGGGGFLFALWFYLITSKENEFVRNNYELILYSPIICVISFGLYAAMIVLYRVYTFNDCEEAAVELQDEIVEAKEQLAKLGFKYQEITK